MIPTYQPDGSALSALISVLAPQVSSVVVADDASPCTSDPVLLAAAERDAVTVVRHAHNAGIARSLNAGLSAAADQGARWLLTVDQDSTLPADYVDGLLASLGAAEAVLGRESVGAIGAGGLDDVSGDVGYPIVWESGIPTTHEVFQTGSLWSVPDLLALGGFDERLGIDGVDAAACLGLRRKGRHIVLAPDVRLGHAYGAGTQYRILGRDVVSTGHSPERRESMVRNRLRLLPGEFAESPRHAFRTIRRVTVNTVLGVTVEKNRWENLQGSARGLRPRKKG